MYNPIEEGGLKILNTKAIQSAAYLHWAEKSIKRSWAKLESNK